MSKYSLTINDDEPDNIALIAKFSEFISEKHYKIVNPDWIGEFLFTLDIALDKEGPQYSVIIGSLFEEEDEITFKNWLIVAEYCRAIAGKIEREAKKQNSAIKDE